MTQGSLYPDGVLVDQTALRRTETTKAAEIKRNRTDLSSRGMFTGGEITVNATDGTRIDVAQLSGYAPSGEYIETTSDYYSIALDDYTLAAVNYVCAVYTEANVGDQPHESDGEVYAVEAQMAWRIRVFEESVFDALPASDTNLANDAKDRCLLIGKVTANGSGIGLTTSNIFSPTDFDNILYSTPQVLSTISGVTITKVSADTAVGDGTVTFDDTGAPTYTLMWTPAVGGAGAAVPFTADGEYNLLDGLGNYITVVVAVSQLPVIGGSTTETVTITNLYNQDIPRHSADDLLHRNKIGTGIVTEVNPHGMSVDDLEGVSVATAIQEHQDVQHCNGIWRESSSSIFGMSLIINTPPGGDTLVVQPPATSDLYYINGRKLNTMAPTNILFTPANFTAGLLGSTVKEGAKLYEVYVDDDSVLKVNLRTDTNATPTPARTVSGVWVIDMSDDHPAGDYDLKCVVTAGPIYTFTWGLNGGTSGLPVVIDNTTPPGVGDAEGQVIRLYDATGVNWIDVYVNKSVYGPSADARLPVGIATYTDTLIVHAHLDYDQNMKIGSLMYWWDISRGTLGWSIDFAGGGGDRQTIDRRPWGNLCAVNIADEALQHIEYDSVDELHYSGILFARDEMNGGFHTDADFTGLDFPVGGGSYYLRGKRMESEGNSGLTVYDDSTSLVYADTEGQIVSMNIGAATSFGNDVLEAMKWVLGSSYERTASPDIPYTADDLDYAEKGVPLYVVTAASGNITLYFDVSRNVNGPVDPWSVGGRRDYTPLSIAISDKPLAAFDSLKAAFLHADVMLDGANGVGGLTVKLIGDSYIFDGFPVTQSLGIDVGGIGSSSTEYPRVSILGTSTSGMWILAGRNRVSRANLVPTLTDGDNDSISMLLSDHCLVDRVDASTTTLGVGVLNLHRVFQVDGEYVEIRGCVIDTSGGAINILSGSDNCYIHHNKISGGTQTDVSYGRSLVYADTVEMFKVSDSYFDCSHRDTNLNPTYPINILNSSGCTVEGNTIFAQNGYVPPSGVHVEISRKMDINNNRILGYNTVPDLNPTSVLQGNDVTGVYVEESSEITIRSNKIVNVGGGIVVAPSSVNGIIIEDNLIDMFYSGGISVLASYVDTDRSGVVSRVSILNNKITRGSMVSGSVGGFMIGIAFTLDFFTLPSISRVEDIRIEGNSISWLVNTEQSYSDTRCISVNLSGGSAGDTPIIAGLSICDNVIENIEATDKIYGITVPLKFNLSSDPSSFSICRNTIDADPTSVTNEFFGVYAFFDTSVSGGEYLNIEAAEINDNGIRAESSAMGAATGIFMGAGLSCTLSGNTIKLNDGTNGIGIKNYCDRSLISNNHIDGRVAEGIILGSLSGGADYSPSDQTVQGNTIREADHYGIRCIDGPAPRWLTISDNDIHITFNVTGIDGDSGIYIGDNATEFSILGNRIWMLSDTPATVSEYIYGIMVGADHRGSWTVASNDVFRDILTIAKNGEYHGIHIDDTSWGGTRGTLNNNTSTVRSLSTGAPTTNDFALWLGNMVATNNVIVNGVGNVCAAYLMNLAGAEWAPYYLGAIWNVVLAQTTSYINFADVCSGGYTPTAF